MSERYPGGIISKTAPTVSTTSAPGVWTLEQQAAYQKAGTWPFGGPFTYIEDVFSTYLYTGNGSTQTITNGIDFSGKGGMLWCKIRNTSDAHVLFDTARGFPNYLVSNASIAQNGYGAANTNDMQPTATGFSMANTSSASNSWNSSGNTFASWSFRKQAKFFDVVTYTGNGVAGRTISHNLGSTPGCLIVKRLDGANSWQVWHRSVSGSTGVLNSTGAFSANQEYFFGNDTIAINPTSTVFTVASDGGVNANGGTYVAYLFAHDAGGFGSTNTDNVISCGSFTANGSGNATITLGYEPQWLLYKKTNAAGSWYIADNMRNGLLATGASSYKALYPNNSNAEAGSYTIVPTATGFQMVGGDPDTFIYIAIRRGPMKTPTSGTSVFAPVAVSGSSSALTVSAGFPTDLLMVGNRGLEEKFAVVPRLIGQAAMKTWSTDIESTGLFGATTFNSAQNSVSIQNGDNITNASGQTYIDYLFRRAPSFMDVVCYTGTGVARTVNHNLGVAPELMIVKSRTQINSWAVYLGGPLGGTKTANLNQTYAAYDSSGHWNNTQPTASVFSIGNNGEVNDSGVTYVNYLFASCAGVSKVGSYSGTGTTKQIDCGFTGGARFVLIKRTDSTGDWYVWDSARGIVAGNDPYLLLNSTAAEVTNTDYVDTYSAGFEISSTAPAAINANGGTFIYLAIA